MSRKHCHACGGAIPGEAIFCPICGFRQQQISAVAHERLTGELAAVRASSPDLAAALAEAAASQAVPLAPAPAGADAAPAEQTAPAPAGADAAQLQRRSAQRFPLRVDVDYTSDHNFYTGFLENISSGGVFIATHSSVALGEELEVAFTVPGLEGTCVAWCQVRWSRDYNPDTPEFPPGIGCQFVDLQPEVAAAIALFIRHREPIFFD